MSKKVSTDFKEVNLDYYLYSALPVRFQDTAPSEFEDFIAFLFKENGYEEKQTGYSSDFGADLIVKRDGTKTAVQVKRYFQLHKVGVSDINQVIGAQQYYQCDQSMMITTSSYTPAAKELAQAASVILWDWHRLEKAICDTFLDGQAHQDYYQAYPVDIKATDSDLLKLEVMSIDLADGHENHTSKIAMRLTNMTDGHLKINCDLPTVITDRKYQFAAIKFCEESFSSGILYANASVDIITEFAATQFSDYHKKDRILLPINLLQTQELLVLEQRLGQVKQECFVVTFYFGRQSHEYAQMILFRDDVLARSWIGRLLVKSYYALGPRAIDLFSGRPKLTQAARPLIKFAINLASRTVGKT
ncbi:MAG: restriction endonuclease [Saprospiraceae bacterium]|nr:restriction endonuclease [Saprospiraceae bacterium]